MKLNERIRQVRIINKLTAKEFGEIFNISLSSVSLYESGRRTPSIDLIIKYPIILTFPQTIFWV